MNQRLYRILTLALYALSTPPRFGRLASLLALLLVLFGPAHATETVVYYHTDALGSPVATTNASGTVIERSEYEPYGKLLNRPLTDGPGYTGHVSDAATGLSYMQQRYYDPAIGRFLSVDPVAADGNTGGNFNRYWYANNNPYTFTDPDGRACDNPNSSAPCNGGPTGQADLGAVGGLILDFTPIVSDAKGFYDAYQDPTLLNIAAAGVGLIPVVGDVAGKAIKNADHLIEAAGKLERLKAGARQGRVQGDANAILGAITDGGKKGAGGRVTMPDGTKIGSHTSTKTGVTTIDVNKGGQVYKIRVDPPPPPPPPKLKE